MNENENNPFSFEHAEEELKRKFKDFLITKEISGSIKGYSKGSLILLEETVDSGEVIEVMHEHENEDIPGTGSTVLVRRNYENEIESIEIICKCGEKTIVRFENENKHFDSDDDSGVILEGISEQNEERDEIYS